MSVTAPQTYAQIDAHCKQLHDTYNPKGLCTRTFANHHTNEPAPGGRQVSVLKIGKGAGPDRPVAVILGGLHARELAPPDAIMSFVDALLAAYVAGTPMTYPVLTVENDAGDISNLPSATIPIGDVRAIIDRVDTYFIPLVNPDGREFDLAHLGTLTDDHGNLTPGWRKNRRPNAAGGDAIGVDLNRNFPIIWDFDSYYDMVVYRSVYTGGDPASKTTTDDTFRGPSAGSEPETQNVKELVDGQPVRLFIDVHSYGRHVLWDWGIEDNGTDPKQSFLNAGLNGTRDGLAPGDSHLPSGHTNYNEFVPEPQPGFRQNLVHLAEVMRDAILAASGNDAQSRYIAHNSSDLYRPTNGGPTSGASDDYAFSTQVTWNGTEAIAGPRAPIFSYTLEVGHTREGGFHPSYVSTDSAGHPNRRVFPKIEREVHFALSSALVWLGRFRAPVTPPPPPPAPPQKTGGSSSICSCSVALDTARWRPVLVFLRCARDDDLGATPAGRAFAARVQAVYAHVSPPLARAMSASAPVRGVVRWAIVLPLAGLVAASRTAVAPVRRDEPRVALLCGVLTVSATAYAAAAAAAVATLVRMVLGS